MGIDYDQLPDKIKKQVDKADRKTVTARVKARPHDSSMNKTERKYRDHLELLKQNGDIVDYRREPFNIRLADRCFYKPDFAVVTNDGMIEIHEVKGYWRSDALVKIKTAAEKLPWFLFKSVKITKSGWEERIFNE